MEILLYGSRISYSIFIRILLRSIAVILRLMSSCTGEFHFIAEFNLQMQQNSD